MKRVIRIYTLFILMVLLFGLYACGVLANVEDKINSDGDLEDVDEVIDVQLVSDIENETYGVIQKERYTKLGPTRVTQLNGFAISGNLGETFSATYVSKQFMINETNFVKATGHIKIGNGKDKRAYKILSKEFSENNITFYVLPITTNLLKIYSTKVPVAENKISNDITITYRKIGSSLDQVSTGRITENSCTVAAPFNCNSFGLSDKTASLTLRNGGGENFMITRVSIGLCGSNQTAIIAPADALTTVIVSCTNPPIVPQKPDIENISSLGILSLEYTKYSNIVIWKGKLIIDSETWDITAWGRTKNIEKKGIDEAMSRWVKKWDSEINKRLEQINKSGEKEPNNKKDTGDGDIGDKPKKKWWQFWR